MKRDHHDSHYGQLCLITGGVLLWMDEIQEMDEMNVQICVCVCVWFVSQFWKFLVCWPWAFAYWKFKVPLVLAHQLSSLTSISMPPLVNNNFYSSQNSGNLGSFWTWSLSIRIGISSSPESGSNWEIYTSGWKIILNFNWEIDLRLKIKVELRTLFQKDLEILHHNLRFSYHLHLPRIEQWT